MSLSRKIADAVNASTAPGRVSAEDGGRRLTLDLAATGPVGVAFHTMTYDTTSTGPYAPESLRGCADAVVSRLTYLMEPLTFVEHDRDAGEIVLRSQSPTNKGERRAYYDVRLHQSGTLRLSRVGYDKATRERRPEPCQMTLEVIERLADDLRETLV